jgi:hypothetical protein
MCFAYVNQEIEESPPKTHPDFMATLSSQPMELDSVE